jgi:hypothetical protein
MYVLYLFTQPSAGKVPARLFYVDGHVWEDDVENCMHIDTREEALKIQTDMQGKYDLQIVDIKEAREW